MQQYKEQYYNGVERMNSQLENKIKSMATDFNEITWRFSLLNHISLNSIYKNGMYF